MTSATSLCSELCATEAQNFITPANGNTHCWRNMRRWILVCGIFRVRIRSHHSFFFSSSPPSSSNQNPVCLHLGPAHTRKCSRPTCGDLSCVHRGLVGGLGLSGENLPVAFENMPMTPSGGVFFHWLPPSSRCK